MLQLPDTPFRVSFHFNSKFAIKFRIYLVRITQYNPATSYQKEYHSTNPRLASEYTSSTWSHPKIVGILNLTADSFYDGGKIQLGRKGSGNAPRTMLYRRCLFSSILASQAVNLGSPLISR